MPILIAYIPTPYHSALADVVRAVCQPEDASVGTDETLQSTLLQALLQMQDDLSMRVMDDQINAALWINGGALMPGEATSLLLCKKVLELPATKSALMRAVRECDALLHPSFLRAFLVTLCQAPGLTADGAHCGIGTGTTVCACAWGCRLHWLVTIQPLHL